MKSWWKLSKTEAIIAILFFGLIFILILGEGIDWQTALGSGIGLGASVWPIIKWIPEGAVIILLVYILRNFIVEAIAEGTEKGIERSKKNNIEDF